MRTLNLMGKLDSGASKSYAILCTLSALLVAVSNVPLLLFSSEIASLVSNDPDVASNLSSIMWVLAVHSQTRISCINANCLFIPIGKGTLGDQLHVGEAAMCLLTVLSGFLIIVFLQV